MHTLEITITWDASTDNIGVKGYELEISGKIFDVGNVLIYKHRGVRPNTTYTYRVRAYDFSYNYSEWSDPEVQVSPNPDLTAPSVPQNLNATSISTSQIDLTWNASTDNVGVAGYILLIQGYAIDVGNVTNYSDTGLDGATVYYYKVRAYDAAGNKSGWSIEERSATQIPVVENGVLVEEGGDQVIEN